jgi:hypothetical protein
LQSYKISKISLMKGNKKMMKVEFNFQFSIFKINSFISYYNEIVNVLFKENKSIYFPIIFIFIFKHKFFK